MRDVRSANTGYFYLDVPLICTSSKVIPRLNRKLWVLTYRKKAHLNYQVTCCTAPLGDANRARLTVFHSISDAWYGA